MTTGRLTIRWANESHSFLAGIEVKLIAGSAPVEPVTPKGKNAKPRLGFYQFDVDLDPGMCFSLHVVVPPPTPPTGWDPFEHSLVDFIQTFHIEGAATPAPDDPTTGWHPRITPIPSAGAGKGALLGLEIDLRFLDVTAYWFKMRQPAFEQAFFSSVDDHSVESGGKRSFKKEDFGGCEVRLLQHTGGDPGVFGVLVPGCIGKGDVEIGGVLYQKPTEPINYKTVHDVSMFSLARYITSFSDGSIWQDSPITDQFDKVEDDDWFGWYHPAVLGKPAGKVSAITSDDSIYRGWGNVPRGRFAQQLGRSQKKAVMLIPLANGDNYGVTTQSKIRALWASVLACLQGDGFIGDASQQTRVTLAKLAVAGFSAGGEAALKTFQANQDDIDEVWMFDANELSTNWSKLIQWRTGERRLRCIGGSRLPFLHTHRKDIGDEEPMKDTYTVPAGPAKATIWPREATFFRRSRVYAKAFAFAEGDSLPLELGVRLFDTVTTAELEGKNPVITKEAFSEATEASGIREVIMENPEDPTAVYLVAVMPNNQVTAKPEAFENFAVSELAEKAIGDLARPIQKADEFKSLAEAWRYKHWSKLHQWPVFGGQSVGDDDDPDNWKGYIELCLMFSQF